ncbi:MAG TPA: ABC transporter ATP-binding protein [bacterium]|nr:ABC transporter ATP-binding protein [bacterium]
MVKEEHTPVIELRGLHKSFGAQKVLNGLNLRIPRGRITVIIGRSGEGKSVLLKTMIGLLQPDEGEVRVEGQEFFELSDQGQNELRKKFGMLFQHAALFDSMNVLENVAFPLREHTEMGEDEIRAKVVEKLSRVGLKDIEHKMPSELSGGMRKRVGLARALMLDPEIILYDEPTTGLDPILTDSIDNLILETQKGFGLTSVVVSHDIQSTMKMADNVAMLYEGRILEQGPPRAFQESKDPWIQKFLQGKADKDFIG